MKPAVAGHSRAVGPMVKEQALALRKVGEETLK